MPPSGQVLLLHRIRIENSEKKERLLENERHWLQGISNFSIIASEIFEKIRHTGSTWKVCTSFRRKSQSNSGFTKLTGNCVQSASKDASCQEAGNGADGSRRGHGEPCVWLCYNGWNFISSPLDYGWELQCILVES